MTNNLYCKTIAEALEELALKKPIILTDDENRENEGDLVMPVQYASVEWVNFFITHGKGLLCTPISYELAQQCGLKKMPKSKNVPFHSCNFSWSVDAAQNITTGISAHERFYTMSCFLDKNVQENDFIMPGHTFPLIGAKGGIQERNGHTEGSLELCRRLDISPVAMICEILADDGSMARGKTLEKFAKKHGFKILAISQLLHS